MFDDEAMRLAMLAENLEGTDYYALLGVAKTCDGAAVRDAFHAFALKFHPDRHLDDPMKHGLALRVFKRGNEAYKVLTHPTLRARYDLARKTGAVRLSAQDQQLTAGDEEREKRQREEADRARRELEEQAKDPGVPLAARPHFERAQAALAKGDFDTAKLEAQQAQKVGRSPKVDRLVAEVNLRALKARSTKR